MPYQIASQNTSHRTSKIRHVTAHIAGNESLENAINWLGEHGDDADIDVPLEIDPASIKSKLSKEEQQKLLDERLAKMRADKVKSDKDLEKQQELGRIQMNKELNEVVALSHHSAWWGVPMMRKHRDVSVSGVPSAPSGLFLLALRCAKTGLVCTQRLDHGSRLRIVATSSVSADTHRRLCLCLCALQQAHLTLSVSPFWSHPRCCQPPPALAPQLMRWGTCLRAFVCRCVCV